MIMTEKGSKFNINYDILQCVEYYIFLKKMLSVLKDAILR